MTQRSLGSFGKRREHAELTFDYFDETIRVNPTFGQFSLIAKHEVDLDDPAQALRVMRSMVEDLIHPDDVERFVQLARENGQEFEDLQEIVTAVIEAAADRPTLPRSGSTGSRSTTATSSPDDVFSLALQAVPEHRPDLRLLVTRAQEHREREAVRSAG